MSEITPDIFRRGVVVSVDVEEGGCTVLDVALDGREDEEPVKVEVPPQPASARRVILYTIGAVDDDTPLPLELPEIAAGTVTAIKSHGADAGDTTIDFKVNGDTEGSMTTGEGWVDVDIPVSANDGIRFVVDVADGTGAALCYMRIAPSQEPFTSPGDRVRVQKEAHRNGGHGRWRLASGAGSTGLTEIDGGEA